MTNSAVAPTPFTFSEVGSRRSIAVASFLAVLLVASGYVIAVQPSDQPSTALTGVAVPSANAAADQTSAPRSALLDGEAFSQAVADSVANSPADQSPTQMYDARSALLDGDDFQLAVDRAVSSSTTALLYEAAFTNAMMNAVDASGQ